MGYRNPRATISVPVDLRDRLREAAGRAGLPMTQLLRIAVWWLERRGLP